MHLEFNKNHKSILNFPAIDIPQFTIISGLNGTGKTHLLEAIVNGSIKNSVATAPHDRYEQDYNPRIRLLNPIKLNISFGDFYAPETQTFSEENYNRFRIYDDMKELILQKHVTKIENLVSSNLPKSFVRRNIWRMSPKQFCEKFLCLEHAEEIKNIYHSAEIDMLSNLEKSDFFEGRDQLSKPNIDSGLRALASARELSSARSIPILNITSFFLQLLLLAKNIDDKEINLSYIFGIYRDIYARNGLMRNRDSRTNEFLSLNDDEFNLVFGPPPWELMNRALSGFSVPIQWEEPPLESLDAFRNRLVRLPGNTPVEFHSLSSGEKIFIHLAASIYPLDPILFKIQKPSILLLDELDSFLHPEMVQKWITAVHGQFVVRDKMQVVVTTHSPTTVALAPDEAGFFEMKSGISGLHWLTKQQAVNNLTFGIPTLSIDYSGRRQVFCESDTDVSVYEGVLARIKSRLSLTHELNFIPVGHRKYSTENYSGAEQVKSIVTKLNANGNNTVYGVIDWDTKRHSEGNILVFSSDRGRAIENIVLNPVLIYLLLIKRESGPESLKRKFQYMESRNWTNESLQEISDTIQYEIGFGQENTLQVDLLDGRYFSVGQNYFHHKSHELEELIKAQFHELRSWGGAKPLSDIVVEQILSGLPEFCPFDFVHLFENLSA